MLSRPERGQVALRTALMYLYTPPRRSCIADVLCGICVRWIPLRSFTISLNSSARLGFPANVRQSCDEVESPETPRLSERQRRTPPNAKQNTMHCVRKPTSIPHLRIRVIHIQVLRTQAFANRDHITFKPNHRNLSLTTWPALLWGILGHPIGRNPRLYMCRCNVYRGSGLVKMSVSFSSLVAWPRRMLH